MPKRSQLSASDLFVVLDRALHRRKPRDCARCTFPYPYRVDSGRDGGPNWEVIPPGDCPQGCALLMEELVLEYGAVYDLKDE